MDWEVELSAEALRDIHSLERKTVQRIIAKLEEAASNPHRYFSKVVDADDYKLRVGDYRVLVLLLTNSNKIFVEKIGHRKNVYKK